MQQRRTPGGYPIYMIFISAPVIFPPPSPISILHLRPIIFSFSSICIDLILPQSNRTVCRKRQLLGTARIQASELIMTGSAFVGQPPMSQDDYYIVQGLVRIMGFPDGKLDPANGLPLPLKRPHNDHYPISYPNQGPGITAAICVAIISVLLVTGARLGLRFFRKDLHWGLEDLFIIPAAVCASSSHETEQYRLKLYFSLALLPGFRP